MKKLLPVFLIFILPFTVYSQPLISFQIIKSGLASPVDVEEVNDGTNRLFIVERGGTIRILEGTDLLAMPFLNVSTSITSSGSEQGLLSLAFHPNYIVNGYFFIYYTNTSGSITIARYSRADANTANPASGVVLMTIPKNYSNHNGGHLAFGKDDYLYFGTGDGGAGGDPDNNAQNPGSLLGKMLRIDVNNPNSPYYSIPPDNPLVGGTLSEIIAWGLRNPWRWSFDKQTGDMWIADVGQNAWEEVNVVTSANVFGKNYGWKCYEGNHVYGSGCGVPTDMEFPIFEYPHNSTTGGYSITGGYRYRGTEFPGLQGYYLCADYVSKNGWLIYDNGIGGWNAIQQNNWAPAGGISSFGEAADGTLYATSLSGTLYKIIASNPLPVKLSSFNGRQVRNFFELLWSVQNEEIGDRYIIEKRKNLSAPFHEVKTLQVSESRVSNQYTIQFPVENGATYFRLKIVASNGFIHYSQAVSFTKKIEIARASIIGKSLSVSLPLNTRNIELYDLNGRKISSAIVTNPGGVQRISLATINKGIIAIRVLVNDEWQVIKLLY